MKHATRMFTAFFVGSAMIAGPATAATPGGLARGPAKTYRSLGKTSTAIANSGTDTGLDLTHIHAVEIIDVNAMDASNHSSANTAPTNTTGPEQQEIRAALQSSAYVMGRLKAQSVGLSRVIAADRNADSTITVYIR